MSSKAQGKGAVQGKAEKPERTRKPPVRKRMFQVNRPPVRRPAAAANIRPVKAGAAEMEVA